MARDSHGRFIAGSGKNGVVDVDHGFRDLMKRASAIRGPVSVKVGVLADSARGGLHRKLPNGMAAPLTVAEIAAVNEFGTQDGKIPPRPAFRQTFDEMRADLEKLSGELLLKVIVDGKMSFDDALDLLGLRLATSIKNAIVAGVSPANAMSTFIRKAQKGKTKALRDNPYGVKPLIDTARMLGAIAWARVIGERQSDSKYVPGSKDQG
jgi:hypothetical protein